MTTEHERYEIQGFLSFRGGISNEQYQQIYIFNSRKIRTGIAYGLEMCTEGPSTLVQHVKNYWFD